MEVTHAGDGHRVDVGADGRHTAITLIKAYQREEVLLLVGKIFLRFSDGGDGLVDAADGHTLQTTHRAALIDDDEVVDVELLGVHTLPCQAVASLSFLIHTIPRGASFVGLLGRTLVSLKWIFHFSNFYQTINYY